MPEPLYALVFLACPVGMGLMMWMMMRGPKKQPVTDESSTKQQAELTRMQAEIDQLRCDRERADVAGRQPSP